jgi:hypothetical protein
MGILRTKTSLESPIFKPQKFGIEIGMHRYPRENHAKEEAVMKNLMLALVMLVGLGQSGCAFLGGAVVGAGATGAAYEIQAHRQMQQLEEDYKAERISRREYEARKKQIEAGSIIY